MGDRGSMEKIMLDAVLGNIWQGQICQMTAWDCADLQMGTAGLCASVLGIQPLLAPGETGGLGVMPGPIFSVLVGTGLWKLRT